MYVHVHKIARINIVSLFIFSKQTPAAAWQQDSLSTHKPRKMQQQKSLSLTNNAANNVQNSNVNTILLRSCHNSLCSWKPADPHFLHIFQHRHMLQAYISCILVDSAYYTHWLHIYTLTLSLWKRMRSGCEHMCEIVIMLCRCQMEVQHRLICTLHT